MSSFGTVKSVLLLIQQPLYICKHVLTYISFSYHASYWRWMFFNINITTLVILFFSHRLKLMPPVIIILLHFLSIRLRQFPKVPILGYTLLYFLLYFIFILNKSYILQRIEKSSYLNIHNYILFFSCV